MYLLTIPVFHERGADLDGKDDVGDANEERGGPYRAVEVAEQPAFRSDGDSSLSNSHSLNVMEGALKYLTISSSCTE